MVFLVGDQGGDGEDAVAEGGVINAACEEGGDSGGKEVYVGEDVGHFGEEEEYIGEIRLGDVGIWC